jgi:Kef-type K+ transport system membrane component KefB
MTLFTLIGTLVFILLMLFVVRPFLEKLISRLRTAHYGDSNVVVLSFIVLLLSAFISEFIGIHMLFGAFLAGILIPHNDTLKQALSSKLEDVSVLLLLPIFFALTGLRLHVNLLDTRDMVFVCVGIVLVATIGKFIGSALPARLLGMNWKDSICIGIFMNTRGLMELVVLNIGYELGILSPALFAMLTIMAIITTIITSPLLDLTEYFFRRKNLS